MIRRSIVLFFVLSVPVYAANLAREPMPESVYEGLKEAIASFYESDPDNHGLPLNLEGLDELREKLQFPKMEELEFLRVTHWRDDSLTMHCWGKQVNDGCIVLWMDDHCDRIAQMDRISRVDIVDYPAEVRKASPDLPACVDSLAKSGNNYNFIKQYLKIPLIRSDREWTLWNVAAGGEPDILSLLFQHAYAAAYYGEREAVKYFLSILLTAEPTYLNGLYDRCALNAMSKGKHWLTLGEPFRKVFERWLVAKKLYGRSKYREELDGLLKDVEAQAFAEIDPTATAVSDPSMLPIDRRIEYYIDRLQETREGLGGNLGIGYWLNSQCSPLVEIGVPAVSALIERMDDWRLTRTFREGRFSTGNGPVFRVGCAVASCIRKILGLYPMMSNFSNKESDWKAYLKSNKREMKKWWERFKDVDPVDWWIGQLDGAPIQCRIEILKKIEAIDPHAIDSISLLKQWAGELNERTAEEEKAQYVKRVKSDSQLPDFMKEIYLNWASRVYGERLPNLANALAERGDFSLLPQMREALKTRLANNKRIFSYAKYVTKYGDADDYRLLYRAVRDELRDGEKPEGFTMIYSVLAGLRETNHSLTVPLLALYLNHRVECATPERPEDRYPYALRAIDAFAELTGRETGYKRSDSNRKKLQAIERLQQWWEREGKHEYAKAHPEISIFEGER